MNSGHHYTKQWWYFVISEAIFAGGCNSHGRLQFVWEGPPTDASVLCGAQITFSEVFAVNAIDLGVCEPNLIRGW